LSITAGGDVGCNDVRARYAHVPATLAPLLSYFSIIIDTSYAVGMQTERLIR